MQLDATSEVFRKRLVYAGIAIRRLGFQNRSGGYKASHLRLRVSN